MIIFLKKITILLKNILLNHMKSFFKAKVKCNRVQEASVHLKVQITEIKVQNYSVRMTTYPRVIV